MEQFYNVKDIQSIFKISQTAAYELMRREDFPSISIGRSKRVKSTDLHEWIEQQKQA